MKHSSASELTEAYAPSKLVHSHWAGHLGELLWISDSDMARTVLHACPPCFSFGHVFHHLHMHDNDVLTNYGQEIANDSPRHPTFGGI